MQNTLFFFIDYDEKRKKYRLFLYFCYNGCEEVEDEKGGKR